MLIVDLSLLGFIMISSSLAFVHSPSSCWSGGGLLHHCIGGDMASGKIICVVVRLFVWLILVVRSLTVVEVLVVS